MRFCFTPESRWPPGAWLATGVRDGDEVLVRHGESVAVHGDWFGEITWDGDYAAVGFDATDLVYGSGGKLDGAGVRFVASGVTTDRLLHTSVDDRWTVSNSLPCLVAAMDTMFDPLNGGYRRRFSSIIQGLDRYDQQAPASRPAISVTYVNHLKVEQGRVATVPAPVIERDFSSYASYRGFLEASLARIAENLRSPARPFAYDLLGTISTGFDSPTVAALGRSAGLREVLTFASARGGAKDDGSAIAERLGLETHARDRDAWQNDPLPEPIFLAADAKGEDVYFAGAQDLLCRRVLLTGYAAGAWAAAPHANPTLRRADQSGLSLAEFRLDAGFLHLPVPLMGVRGAKQADLDRLREELRPWASGKSYDKPFCRRVLSEAGVPNKLYGQEKKAASVLVFDRRSLLSPGSKRDFMSHLTSARREQPTRCWSRAGRDLVARTIAGVAFAARSVAGRLSPLLRSPFLKRIANSDRLKEYAYYEPLAEYLFPWAIRHATRRYASSDAAGEPNTPVKNENKTS